MVKSSFTYAAVLMVFPLAVSATLVAVPARFRRAMLLFMLSTIRREFNCNFGIQILIYLSLPSVSVPFLKTRSIFTYVFWYAAGANNFLAVESYV